MRKIFNLSALLMLLVFMLTGISAAKAQTQIEFGKKYEAPAYQYFNGAITINSPGTLTVVVTGTEGTLYSPSDVEIDWDGHNYLDNGQEYTYNLTQTGTYNYICPMPWDASTYTFTFDGEGGGNTGGGGGDTSNVLPVPTSNFTLSQNYYTYTPASDGVLTIIYKNLPFENCLYAKWENGHGDDRVALVNGANVETDTEFQWALEGGHTYYLQSDYPANNVVTTSFAAAGGGSADIDGYAPVQLGLTYDIADGETLAVYYKATENGTLTVNQWGTSDPYLFTTPSKNPEDYGNMAEGSYTGEDPYVFSYDVEAGTTYYYYGVHDNASYFELYKVSFAFEAGNGGTDTPGPTDTPEGWSALEFNKDYSVTSVGGTKLFLHATESGVLKVTQTGSFDGHMFIAEPVYSQDYGYENNMGILYPTASGGEYEGTNPYILTYAIVAGRNYYYLGKLSSGDELSKVSFTFEVAEASNEIELEKPYIVDANSPVYVFTPEESGILYVQWSNPYGGDNKAYDTGIVWGSQQYFLWNDYACSEPTPSISVSNGNGQGWLVTFNVEAGENYYLHLSTVYEWQCVFTMQAGATMEPSIVDINPTPGSAYDVVNYRYYWNMTTAPTNATIDKIELTYVPANAPATTTTIEVSGTVDRSPSGELQIPADELVSRLEANEIAPETVITFTLYGLKVGDKYVSQSLMDNDAVVIGENGTVKISYSYGTPIKLVSAKFPDPFLKAWERGDQAGIATLVYDQDIYSVGEVSVSQGHQIYGTPSGDDVYSQVVPEQNVTVKGNTITIDFTNISWMMPAGTTEVTVTVNGPTGVNKLPASYDGYPVLQEYIRFTTDGSADIPDPLISNIDPWDGAPVKRFQAEETLSILFYDWVNESDPEKVTGVLVNPEGETLVTANFEYRPMDNKWIYEFPEGTDIKLFKGSEYEFTVTVLGVNNSEIGTETVYWKGDWDEKTDAVNGIEPAEVTYVVYSVDGIKVLTTTNAADLNNLEKGRLYIINGKKVVIKK